MYAYVCVLWLYKTMDALVSAGGYNGNMCVLWLYEPMNALIYCQKKMTALIFAGGCHGSHNKNPVPVRSRTYFSNLVLD
jgi:hypothetical protein